MSGSTKTQHDGITENQLTERWADRPDRAAERAEAARKLEALRNMAVAKTIHRARVHAIESGAPRYVGSPCRRDPAHGTLRYTSGGGCVACATAYAERGRRRKGQPIVGPRPTARHSLRSERRSAARREGDAIAGVQKSSGWPHYGRHTKH